MHVFVTYVGTFMEHGKVLCATLSECFGLRDILNIATLGGVWAVLTIFSDKVEIQSAELTVWVSSSWIKCRTKGNMTVNTVKNNLVN